MGQDGVADLLVRQAAEHGHLDDGDDLPGVVTEEGHAEYLVRVGVDDGFHIPTSASSSIAGAVAPASRFRQELAVDSSSHPGNTLRP